MQCHSDDNTLDKMHVSIILCVTKSFQISCYTNQVQYIRNCTCINGVVDVVVV